MDLRLREVTWLRLLSLLLWTILMMLKRGITQLIEGIEERVFESSAQSVDERNQEGDEEERTLLPPLNDDLVLGRIWPLLHRRVNVSLLWRLRRVNRAWREKVAGSLEWAALEIVRVDTPGLTRYLMERRERRPSLRERVEDELRSISVLLSENLVELSSQPEFLRVKTVVGKVDEEVRSSTGGSVKYVHSTRELGCPCCGETYHYNGSESEQGEEVELDESWSSTSENSVTVFYPRHAMRV